MTTTMRALCIAWVVLAVGCNERDEDPRSAPAPQAVSESESDTDTDTADAELAAILAGMGVAYLPQKRRLEIAGHVNQQRGAIEVFACAPEGKTHEAVVVMDCVPSGVHAGLLALGLEPGEPAKLEGGEFVPPHGAAVIVEVRWKDEGGVDRSARAEDWVLDGKAKRSMPRVEWVFTGSTMQAGSADPEDVAYAANFIQSIVTTYHDATAILENPLRAGSDDTIYQANEAAVPPERTPITVVLRPAR